MSPLGHKERADRLRAVPLESVLRLSGAKRDQYDRFKWHTPQGTLSVTGAKFMNWTRGVGGGGAIDLVMHLNHAGFNEALQWLERHVPGPLCIPSSPPPSKPDFKLPSPQPRYLERVKRYLALQRAIPAALIQTLIQSGTLYADHRANAVFVLLGEGNNPVGAEMRGTGLSPWRGMAPGSQKDLGFFSTPFDAIAGPPPEAIILCESAIDALSCFVLHPNHRCISTAGARPNPRWLPALLQSGCPVCCGFDADPTGEAMAQAMIALHPVIQRSRPSIHDWNDLLRSDKSSQRYLKFPSSR